MVYRHIKKYILFNIVLWKCTPLNRELSLFANLNPAVQPKFFSQWFWTERPSPHPWQKVVDVWREQPVRYILTLLLKLLLISCQCFPQVWDTLVVVAAGKDQHKNGVLHVANNKYVWPLTQYFDLLNISIKFKLISQNPPPQIRFSWVMEANCSFICETVRQLDRPMILPFFLSHSLTISLTVAKIVSLSTARNTWLGQFYLPKPCLAAADQHTEFCLPFVVAQSVHWKWLAHRE